MLIRKFSLRLILLLLFISGIAACEKKKEQYPDNQKVYFEVYGISWAWGFDYYHWIIDNKGNIRINHNPDSVFWIDAENVDACLSYFDSVIYSIDPVEFKKYTDMIPAASEGEYDCKTQKIFDIGTTAYYCFRERTFITLQYETNIKLCKNLDSSAVKLSKWLMDLQYTSHNKK